jgi:hypothetical protein
MRHEMSRLDASSLVDVSPGAKVQPDVLMGLFKVTVPSVRRSCDQLREAMKIYSRDQGASRSLALLAQKAYERAEDWICDV